MNITQSELEPHVSTFRVEIAHDDYWEEYDKQLRAQRKTLTIRGFRPGHVPLPMAKRLVGERVLADVLQKRLDEALGSYLKEKGIVTFTSFLSNADQPPFDPQAEGDYVFMLDAGVLPALNVDLSEEQVPLYVAKPTPEELEAALERDRKRTAPQDAVDEKTEYVILNVVCEKVGEKVPPKEGCREFIDLAGNNAEARELLLGKRKDDGAQLDYDTIVKLLGDKEKLTHFYENLAIAPQDAKDFHIFATIGEIAHHELAEITPKFYENLVDPDFGQEKLPEDLEALRHLYDEQAADELTYGYELLQATRCFDILLGKWDFTLSEGFRRRLLGDAEEQTPERLERFSSQIKHEGLVLRLMERWKEGDFDTPEMRRAGRVISRGVISQLMAERGIPSVGHYSLRFMLGMMRVFGLGDRLAEPFERGRESALASLAALRMAKVTTHEVTMTECESQIKALREEMEAESSKR